MRIVFDAVWRRRLYFCVVNRQGVSMFSGRRDDCERYLETWAEKRRRGSREPSIEEMTRRVASALKKARTDRERRERNG